MADRSHAPLNRKSRFPVWVSIAWRVAFSIGLLIFAVFVHWLERDGLKDNADGHISFIDVIYFTMISVTTTGYGDIVPLTRAGAPVRCADCHPDSDFRRADFRRHGL